MRESWDQQLEQLRSWGLSAHFEKQFRALSAAPTSKQEGVSKTATDGAHGRAPGRIILELRGELTVMTADGERVARIPGRLRHRASSPEELPAIGDWVVLAARQGEGFDRIEAILDRTSCIMRKTPGERTEQQVVAANVDTVLIVMALDTDFNPRRLERLLLTVRDSGAAPVVVLSKSDLSADTSKQLSTAEAVAAGAPIHAVSNKTAEGIEDLHPYLSAHTTLALMGSSGAGKSSLVNTLCGTEVMPTGEVRSSDDKGKHTTSHRQLIRLPGGALLIDNPGIREIQLWVSEESIAATFPRIAALAQECRFRDCTHDTEPGCAIRAAIEEGTIDRSRFESYQSLGREQEELETRQTELERAPGRRSRRRRR